jgi:hypothetical protein
MVVAALAILGGLAVNWSWLVAVGIAPLILGALPCVVMCAMGLCFMKKPTGRNRSETGPERKD